DPVSYSAEGLPSGLSIDSNKGVISGRMANDADTHGPFSVTVTATDGITDVSANKTFDWSCSPVLATTGDTPSIAYFPLQTTSTNFGQPATLTAQARAADVNNATVPTGTITFMEGTTILGTRPLNAAGQATLTISTLSIGNHQIT